MELIDRHAVCTARTPLVRSALQLAGHPNLVSTEVLPGWRFLGCEAVSMQIFVQYSRSKVIHCIGRRTV